MLVDGKVKSITTGTNIEGMKEKLFYAYFHIPNPTNIKPKRRRRT